MSSNGSHSPVFRTALRGLERIHEGKVRDIYAVDAETMLIVTTDRLSAFDVVLPDPIPEKGRVLTEISNFWFGRTRHIVPNQLTDRSVDSIVKDADERELLRGRTMVVRRLKALPIEAVVRGYLIGSGWKDYQKTGCAVRNRIAAGPEAGGAPRRAVVYSSIQSSGRPARREHFIRGR